MYRKSSMFSGAMPSVKSALFPLLILAIFVAWETINYFSTAEGITSMFGEGVLMRVVFSGAVVVNDGLFLSMFILGWMNATRAAAELGRRATKEEISEAMQTAKFGKLAAAAWVVLTVFDTFLTWYWFAVLMEANIAAGNMTAPASIIKFINWFPGIIAAMTWAAQAVLMTTLGQIIVEIAQGSRRAQRPGAPTRSGTLGSVPPTPGGNNPSAFRPQPRPSPVVPAMPLEPPALELPIADGFPFLNAGRGRRN